MNEEQGREQKKILITGASKGHGFTLASFLAASGHELIITARDGHALEEARLSLVEQGGIVRALVGDVSDPEHRASLTGLVSELGGLDVLINNASSLGPTPMPYLEDYPLDGLRCVFEVNVFGPLALVQSLLPWLIKSRGLVVNISSDAAEGGYEGWGGYGASKAALDLISLTLANELKNSGVGVVSVDPGDMQTGMQQAAFPGEDISDRPLPEITLPFWAWLLGRRPAEVSGQRFKAQSELWQVAR